MIKLIIIASVKNLPLTTINNGESTMTLFAGTLKNIKSITIIAIIAFGLCACSADSRHYTSAASLNNAAETTNFTETADNMPASSSNAVSNPEKATNSEPVSFTESAAPTETVAANESETNINEISDMLKLQPSDDGTKVISSWEEYEAQRFPLIAAIPDKNVYLYAIRNHGVILYYNNIGHFYDWNYLTPRFILPRMELADFDSDGKEELGVILYVGSGTGISIEELHIIEVSEEEVLSRDPADKNYFVPNKEYFRDYLFTNYGEQLEKQVKLHTIKKGSSLWAEVTVGKKVESFKLENSEDDINNKNISFENIVRFEFEEGRIKAQFALGALRKSYAAPDFIGEINSEVKYDKGCFLLQNLSFQKYSDN